VSDNLIGIFISSEFHARSLVESKLLRNLIQKYRIVLFTTKALKETYFLNYSSITHIEIKITDAQTKYFSKHLVLGTLRFINRSTSYKFRLKRQIFGDYYTQNPTFIVILKRVLDLMRVFTKITISFVLSKSTYYQIIKKQYMKSVETMLKDEVFEKYKFDLLIGWCQTSEPTAIAPIIFGQKFKVPSFLVIDNWDNLASKSVFPLEPSAIACFGNQSLDFARNIQRFKHTDVYAIGSARFEVYRGLIESKEQNDPKEIVFAGSSLVAEDQDLLELLNNYCERHKSITRIKYRRHPYPQGKKINLEDIETKFKNIYVENYQQKGTSLQSLEDTCKSLSQTRILIAMPTTFLLEGILCRIPTILISFKSKAVRYNSHRMLKELEHLKGINEVDNIHIVSTPVELFKQLDLRLHDESVIQAHPKGLEYYVSWNSESFGTRLCKSMDNTINDYKNSNLQISKGG
jgi:hypothetical protein